MTTLGLRKLGIQAVLSGGLLVLLLLILAFEMGASLASSALLIGTAGLVLAGVLAWFNRLDGIILSGVARGYVAITAAVGIWPLCLWVSWVLAACAVSRQMDHWPYYGHPDPKELPASLFDGQPYLLAVVPCIQATWIATQVIVITRHLPARWWLLVSSGLGVICWGGFLVLCYTDPGGVCEWVAD